MHDPRTLIRSLKSDLCPACGQKKRPRQTFCGRCYYQLPPPARRALYALVGKGYEQAFQDALTFLEVETPAFPPPPSQNPSQYPAQTFSKTRAFRAPKPSSTVS